MSLQNKPYSIHKRGKIFYAQFKLPDNHWSNPKSTRQNTKSRAEKWCIDYLSQGKIVNKENITFEQFAKDFFDWNNSWATDKRARGLRIGQRHCQERNDLLKNHIIPAFGQRKLTQIDRALIKEFRNNLFTQGYSGSTINKILSTIKSILESAEEQSLIQFIPRIDRAADVPKQKGILTIEEVQKLFSIEWPDIRGYVGNLLAATTGLRLGEIQALTISDLHLSHGYITVKRSWDNRSKLLNETTKTGRERKVFIPATVQDALKKLLQEHPEPLNGNAFLFFSTFNLNHAAVTTTFVNTLYNGLKSIGITTAERKNRNITFHSWRHWLNSLLINSKIPIQKIQSITGHVTNEMSQHYYHIDDMSDVLQVQSNIFKTNCCI